MSTKMLGLLLSIVVLSNGKNGLSLLDNYTYQYSEGKKTPEPSEV